jgi:hypothetical protein
LVASVAGSARAAAARRQTLVLVDREAAVAAADQAWLGTAGP